MICIIALFVFSILGIFSASHRRVAKEAFGCVARRIVLKPCKARLEERARAKITSKLLRRAPRAARFTHRHFEAISWVFTILLFSSMVYSAYGLYNLASYGSCDPHSTECIFSPDEVSCKSVICEEQGCFCETLGCEEPEYQACGGDCVCIKDVCG